MNIVNLKGLKGEQRGKQVTALKIPSEFKAQSVNIIIQPNGELPLHTTTVDVIFYVIKGRGIIEIGDEKKEVEEGNFIDSPANIPHAWYNPNTEELSVLVIKLFS